MRLVRDEAGMPQFVARPCYYQKSFGLQQHLTHIQALNECGVALPDVMFQQVSENIAYLATRHIESPYQTPQEALKDPAALMSLDIAIEGLERYVGWAQKQPGHIVLADLCAIRQHVFAPQTDGQGRWYLVDLEPIYGPAESPNIREHLDKMRTRSVI